MRVRKISTERPTIPFAQMQQGGVFIYETKLFIKIATSAGGHTAANLRTGIEHLIYNSAQVTPVDGEFVYD